MNNFNSSKPTRLSKVYFTWVIRDYGTAEWFHSLLHAIEEQDTQGRIEINIYLTAKIKEDDMNNIIVRSYRTSLGYGLDTDSFRCRLGTRRGCGEGRHHLSACSNPLWPTELGPCLPLDCREASRFRCWSREYPFLGNVQSVSNVYFSNSSSAVLRCFPSKFIRCRTSTRTLEGQGSSSERVSISTYLCIQSNIF